MRAAVAIFRGGSISAAARTIHLTQPAITQGLANLEQTIGHRLFERRANGMTPTEAASIAIPRFEAALALVPYPRITAAQARAFIEVARAGGYAAAAQNAGIAGASLHRAVGDLGLAFGSALLERRGDGVAPTRRGQELLRRLTLARGELISALDELAMLTGRETGRLIVGAMPLSRARLLPAALGRFLTRHPDFSVTIIEGGHADLVGPLRAGDIDVMIGALRSLPASSDLVERPLIEDRPIVLGRAGHPLAATSPSIADLARFPWTIAAPGAPLHDQWARMFGEAGIDKPRVPVESGSVMAIRELLIGSDFLTMLSPDQVAAELAAGWLTSISAAPPSIVRTIGITVRKGWSPTPLQQKLLDTIDAVADERRSQNPMASRSF